jgi:hypothetical protein
MNWLDIAGGIGKGVSLGTKDLREMQDENLRREMQKQEMTLRQQSIDENTRREKVRTDMKGIRKPGDTSYRDDLKEAGAGSQQARMLEQQTKDFGEEGATKTKEALGGKGPAKGKKVTEGDRMRDASDVYAEHGELDKSVAASQQARTMDSADRSEATMAKFRQMMPMVEQDPVGFLTQYAPDWYKKMVPDGHTAVTASTPQGVQISLYDDKQPGRIIHQRTLPTGQLKMAAKDIAEKMFLYEMGQISPEMFVKSFELGLKGRETDSKVALGGAQAAAHQAAAAKDEAYTRTGGFGLQAQNEAQGRMYGAQQGYYGALANQANAHARLYGAQAGQVGQPPPLAPKVQITTMQRGKERVPVVITTDSKGVTAKTLSGEVITDQKQLNALFTQQPTDVDDPAEAALVMAAAQTGDITIYQQAVQHVARNRQVRMVQQKKAQFEAMSPEEKVETFNSAKDMPKEIKRAIFGNYKPPTAATVDPSVSTKATTSDDAKPAGPVAQAVPWGTPRPKPKEEESKKSKGWGETMKGIQR